MKKKLVELSLLFRLTLMGYLLLVFSLGFFIYALNTRDLPLTSLPEFIPEEELSSFVELSPDDAFNFFAVSALFAALAVTCLLTSRKRRRSLTGKK